MTLDCPHGFRSRAACYDCMLDGPVVAPKKTKVATSGPESIVAYIAESKYDGQCPECNLPIHIGEQIYMMSGGDRKWYIHIQCLT